MVKYLSVSGVAPSSISRRVMLGDSMKNSFVSRDYHHGKPYQPRLWKMMFLWEKCFFFLGTICWISGLWKCHWGLPSSLWCLAKAHSSERILVTRPAIIIHDLPIAREIEYGIWMNMAYMVSIDGRWWYDDMAKVGCWERDGTPIFFRVENSPRIPPISKPEALRERYLCGHSPAGFLWMASLETRLIKRSKRMYNW
jgi:hypothetical protein